ncbi:hypothetical protein NC653_037884 [Populus alba x Populus x berolinensis]|uniref:Transmembrane protein n=1 Tax=Populus alba x Populus x berolinensis TaxID=444605 RepID=A0AAD6LFA3_9ROSI|nr:hypothetical protein NC653_037884 [Populus alba x Populus x berolinensis]
MAGSATFLLPLHFYTSGVIHRCHGWEIGVPFSLGFLPPSTVLRLVFLLRWLIWWLGVLLLLCFRWLVVKRNNREGGVAARPVRLPLGLGRRGNKMAEERAETRRCSPAFFFLQFGGRLLLGLGRIL